MTKAIRCDGCGHFKAGTGLHVTMQGKGFAGFGGQLEYDFCSLDCIVAFANRQRDRSPELKYCGVMAEMAESLGRAGEEHGPRST